VTYKMAGILGAPGSGKTSLVDSEVWHYRHTHPEAPVWIVDPNNAFPGDPGSVWPPDADVEGWLIALKAMRAKQKPQPPSGLLVLDDADRYLAGGPPRGIWRDLFTSFRHWRLNILWNARRTQDVPKVLLASSETLYLFRHRDVYGPDYLARQNGEHIRELIPHKAFHYTRVDVDTGETWAGKTRKRDIVLPSDGDMI
jgi:hypothetical protein